LAGRADHLKHETVLLLLYSVGNRALVLSLPKNRRPHGTDCVRCFLMYVPGGGRGWKYIIQLVKTLQWLCYFCNQLQLSTHNS